MEIRNVIDVLVPSVDAVLKPLTALTAIQQIQESNNEESNSAIQGRKLSQPAAMTEDDTAVRENDRSLKGRDEGDDNKPSAEMVDQFIHESHKIFETRVTSPAWNWPEGGDTLSTAASIIKRGEVDFKRIYQMNQAALQPEKSQNLLNYLRSDVTEDNIQGLNPPSPTEPKAQQKFQESYSHSKCTDGKFSANSYDPSPQVWDLYRHSPLIRY